MEGASLLTQGALLFGCTMAAHAVCGHVLRRRAEGSVVPLCRLPADSDSSAFVRFPAGRREVELRATLLDWIGEGETSLTYDSQQKCYFISSDGTDRTLWSNRLRHSNVYCDLCLTSSSSAHVSADCGARPIRGERHRCIQCDDFDCCSDCLVQHSSTRADQSPCGHRGHELCTFRHIVVPGSELVHESTYADCLINMMLNYGNLQALGYMAQSDKVNDSFVWYSYRELLQCSLAAGSGLRALGMQPQGFLLICASNSVEFMMMDLACGIYGFVMVPIGPNVAEDAALTIFRQVCNAPNCTTLVCSKDTYVKCIAIAASLWRDGPQFNIIVLNSANNESTHFFQNLDRCCQNSFTSLCRLGVTAGSLQPERIFGTREEEDRLVAIAFTSGTTAGQPKGIPITIKHRMNTLRKYAQNYNQSRVSREVSLVFTNMCYHATRDELLYLLLGGGCGVVYMHLNDDSVAGTISSQGCRDRFSSLLHQFRLLRPTFISAVPAFWIELYNRYCEDQQHAEMNLCSPKADQVEKKAVKKKEIDTAYAAMFGTRLVQISTGSAHTPEVVFRFMKTIIGNASLASTGGASYLPRQVFEGYGAMEVGGIASNGLFIDGVSWKVLLQIADEIATVNTSELVGELLVKSSQMSDAYYHNDDMTRQRFDIDGFFATGDLVRLDCHCGKRILNARLNIHTLPAVVTEDYYKSSCGCMHIGGPRVTVIGRTDAMLKLSDGETLSPELIEGILIQCHHILQIFVYAEINWSSPAAVVVVPLSLLNSNDQDTDDMAIAKAVVSREMEDLVMSGTLPNKHTPSALVLTAAPFTVTSGLLTVSEKKCRKNLIKRYKIELRNAYAGFQNQFVQHTISSIMQPVLAPDLGTNAATGHFSGSARIWDHGLNSLRAAAIASEMGSKLGLPTDLSLYLLSCADTVDKLSDLVAEHRARQDTVREGEIIGRKRGVSAELSFMYKWKKQAVDDLNWKFGGTLSVNNPSSIEKLTFACGLKGKTVVLLTGGNGFLGSMILSRLLMSNKFCVIAVVRNAFKQGRGISGETRLWNELAKHYYCDPYCEAKLNELRNSGNLIVVEGDITSPDIGLMPSVYAQIQATTDVIIHCAATTSFTASYVQLRGINVVATENMLSFALADAARLIPFHFISTLSAAFEREECAPWSYAEYDKAVRNELNSSSPTESGYKLSKSIAEALVRKSGLLKGLPYTIVRPGTISAHLHSGYSNCADFTTRLIQSIGESRMVPRHPLNQTVDINGSIDLAAVDYVAEVVCSVVMAGDAAMGLTIHVCNSEMTSFDSIFEAVEAYFADRFQHAETKSAFIAVSFSDWIASIEQNEKDPLHFLANQLSEVLSSRRVQEPSFLTTDLRDVLGQAMSVSEAMCRSPPFVDPRNLVAAVLNWLAVLAQKEHE